jgi:hypothetical protein
MGVCALERGMVGLMEWMDGRSFCIEGCNPRTSNDCVERQGPIWNQTGAHWKMGLASGIVSIYCKNMSLSEALNSNRHLLCQLVFGGNKTKVQTKM